MVMLGLARKHSSILGIKPKLAFIRQPYTIQSIRLLSPPNDISHHRRRKEQSSQYRSCCKYDDDEVNNNNLIVILSETLFDYFPFHISFEYVLRSYEM